MNKTYSSVIIISITLLHFALGFAEKERSQEILKWEQQVREHVEAFGEAFAVADVEALDALLADDYVHTNTDGSVHNKSSWLKWMASRHEEIKTGKIKIHRFENHDVHVRIYGNDTAVVTGKNHVRDERSGSVSVRWIRFTHVWIKSGNGWRRAAFHDSRLDRK